LLCTKCGSNNPDDAVFCQSCGSTLGGSQQQPASGGGFNRASWTSSTTSAPTASFSISSAFRDAIALVKSPAAFMTANRENDAPIGKLMINYVAVLAAIPFIATLIGDLWYYGLVFRGAGVGYAFAAAILTYILDIVAVFVVGFLTWKLAPNFGTTTTQERATRIAAYAFTPAFLISILNIIPFIGFISVLGLLYGLYILYLGLPILMNTPKDKVLTYVIVIVIATLVVYAVVGAIIGTITAVLFLTSVGLF
jgi:Yip1 domain/zinc-ribbon domain